MRKNRNSNPNRLHKTIRGLVEKLSKISLTNQTRMQYVYNKSTVFQLFVLRVASTTKR